ncbi:helix-turn-helix domain-containing protein [Nocardia sp. 2]|uniref:Helix-turn-helix domain-containing protein n=1 Tax=Nocardia acididurans TaxID=2802282 RepID=A0ABS1LYT5_9NOCA|nr:helix-turn-helix domain-containing protein [Nocardia acididurans]MBL1073424.1 helix-turn-helix domain-containing protein [Nocardia acididurans]
MAKGQLAVFVRARRDALKMTQVQLANATGWSKSAIEKVEAGSLIPSLEFVGALFDALGISYLYRERIIAALYPGALDRIIGPSPAMPDVDALADLEDLPYPAAYLTLPECDILGTNTAWNDAFPGLEAKSNLLTFLFTDPSAPDLLVEWELVAHMYAYMLRILGPISLPESAITEIVDRCKAHPDFERMYAADYPATNAVLSAIRVADPVTGQIRDLRIKVDKPHVPYSPWVTYRLVPPRDGIG